MSERIHYDDNFFFLTAMIRTLTDAVKLKVDVEFFADKILEDILFIDSTIQRIYESLKKNTRLIRREVYLHSLMKLKKAYGRLLDVVLNADGSFAEAYESVLPQLRRLAAAQITDVRLIREEVGSDETLTINSDMISYDELHYLMKPMEEEQES